MPQPSIKEMRQEMRKQADTALLASRWHLAAGLTLISAHQFETVPLWFREAGKLGTIGVALAYGHEHFFELLNERLSASS